MVKYVNLSVDLFNFIKDNQPVKNKDILEEFENKDCSRATINRRLKTMVKDGYFFHEKPHAPYTINEQKHPNKSEQDKIKSRIKYISDLSYKQQEIQCEILELNDEFRGEIYGNLRERIKIAGKEPHFSNLMNEYIHHLVDSLLINGFLLNPDLWYSLKIPEDFKFEIKLELDLSKSLDTIKKLKEKFEQAVNLKVYPDLETEYPLFDPDEYAGDPPKSPFIQIPPIKYSWKDYIGNRTLKDLRYRAIGEHTEREERLVKLSEGVDELGNNFMVLIEKERKYLQKNPQKLKILEKFQNELWKNMHIDYTRTFEKEFGIYWEDSHPYIVPITLIKNQIQLLNQEIDIIKTHPNQSIEEYLKSTSSISKMLYLGVILTRKINIKDSISEIYPYYTQKLESLIETLGKYEK